MSLIFITSALAISGRNVIRKRKASFFILLIDFLPAKLSKNSETPKRKGQIIVWRLFFSKTSAEEVGYDVAGAADEDEVI